MHCEVGGEAAKIVTGRENGKVLQRVEAVWHVHCGTNLPGYMYF